MVKITLYPFDKIMLDGTEVFLGMEQSDVARAIGEGKKIGTRCYYCNGELAIDYSNYKVNFIEFLGGIDGILKPDC